MTTVSTDDDWAQLGRYQTLVRSIRALRRTTWRPKVETIYLVIGGIFMPLGLIAIFIGWYGSAHTIRPYDQNDYLISGGLGGVGLILFGGFLYLGHWLSHLVRRSDDRDTEIVNLLSEIKAEGRSREIGDAATAVAAERGVVTVRGNLVHRVGCPTLKDRVGLKEVDLDDPNYRLCRICMPMTW
jgi:hypothetical protein